MLPTTFKSNVAFTLCVFAFATDANAADANDSGNEDGRIVVFQREKNPPVFLDFKVQPASGAAAARNTAKTETFTGKVIRQSLELQAKDYVIKVAGSKGKALELHDKSLLNWSNPGRRTEQGVVMVWHDGGLPLAIASLFTYEWQGTKVKHEFVSLGDAKLEATFDGQETWAPNKPGVKWTTWSNGRPGSSSEVAAAKRRRLLQMRTIAREFEVTMKDERNKTSSLRLLTEPLYRFSSEKHGIVDGAIFAFAVATDPEAFLIVRGDEKEKLWRFGFVPSMYYELTAKRNKKIVWHFGSVMKDHINNSIGNERLMGEPYLAYRLTPSGAFHPHPEVKVKEEVE